jgi:CDP-diacylglycerol--serine O-phosphatidyltransferase
MGKEIRPLVILVMTYGLAFLMVSSIPYRSLKGFNLRDRKPFHVLVAMVLLLIIVVAEPQVLLFFLFGLYTLSGIIEKPLIALYQRVHRRGKRKPKEQEGKNQKTAFEDL